MEETYLVTGTWKGQEVRETVSAVSQKQAKLKAGFNLAVGREMGEFLRSNKIRASRK
jgi:hypothetical protein